MNFTQQVYSVSVLALLLSAAATAHAQTSQANDEAAIRFARVTQTKALAANDLDRVVSFWTPDITIRRALGQPLSGVAEARKALEPAAPIVAATATAPAAPTVPAVPAVPAAPAAPAIIYQREAVSVTVSSNWPLAYEEGRWSGHSASVDTPAIIGGRYSAQWVKRDGKWFIRSEVFVALTCLDAGCKFAAGP